jgi:hypothetical protein
MDNKEAKDLLNQIQQEKTAAKGSPVTDAVMKSQLNRDALKDIANYLMLGAGAGVAMRGATGIANLLRGDQEVVPSKTVDMPVLFGVPKKVEDDEADKEDIKKLEYKSAEEKEAYSKSSLPYYLPAMLLGTPLAAYGGWKAVDAVLDKQRKAKSEDNLEEAKSDYEAALLDSYKKSASTDEMLDEVFNNYKEANTFNDILGTGKGLALTYALAAGPLGYMMVNSQMKKNSKRKILEKAMRERARRQAAKQPAELYAIPAPVEYDENEETQE